MITVTVSYHIYVFFKFHFASELMVYNLFCFKLLKSRKTNKFLIIGDLNKRLWRLNAVVKGQRPITDEKQILIDGIIRLYAVWYTVMCMKHVNLSSH